MRIKMGSFQFCRRVLTMQKIKKKKQSVIYKRLINPSQIRISFLQKEIDMLKKRVYMHDDESSNEGGDKDLHSSRKLKMSLLNYS